MHKKPVIGFVIASLKLGGAQKVATILANFLSQQYQIIIFVFDESEPFFELNASVRVRFVQIKKRGIQKGLLGNLARICLLLYYLKKERVSLVVSFIHQSNVLAIVAAFLLIIPSIATEHSIYDALSQKRWRILRRSVYPLASWVFVLTNGDLEHYAFLRKVSVMPNPIVIKANAEIGACRERPYILSVGRLVQSKHFDELLEVFAQFHQIYPLYQLVIVGDGQEMAHLQNKAQRLGICVEFVGCLQELYAYYSGAEFFVSMSYQEGFGNVLVESLLCGTPVVAYDCPYGPREIICHGKDGYLVPLGNTQAMLETWILLAEKKLVIDVPSIQERFSNQRILEAWDGKIRALLFDKEQKRSKQN